MPEEKIVISRQNWVKISKDEDFPEIEGNLITFVIRLDAELLMERVNSLSNPYIWFVSGNKDFYYYLCEKDVHITDTWVNSYYQADYKIEAKLDEEDKSSILLKIVKEFNIIDTDAENRERRRQERIKAREKEIQEKNKAREKEYNYVKKITNTTNEEKRTIKINLGELLDFASDFIKAIEEYPLIIPETIVKDVLSKHVLKHGKSVL